MFELEFFRRDLANIQKVQIDVHRVSHLLEHTKYTSIKTSNIRYPKLTYGTFFSVSISRQKNSEDIMGGDFR